MSPLDPSEKPEKPSSDTSNDHLKDMSRGEVPTSLVGHNSSVARITLSSERSRGEFETVIPDEQIFSANDEDAFRASLPARYTLQRILGHGGMGIVYLATDASVHGRWVAIKRMLDTSGVQSKRAFESFIAESRNAATLNHPHIVHVYDSSDRGVPYLVMEYADRGNLSNHIGRSPLELDEAVEIALQIARALVATHRKGVLHRDVKPNNIVLCQSDIPGVSILAKLTDFGIALPLEQAIARRDISKAGTKYFIAPEILSGAGPIDEMVDVFGFGVTIYQMVTGRLHEEVQIDLTPRLFRELVNNATADRSIRYRSMLEVVNELEQIQKTLQSRPRRHSQTHASSPVLNRGECYRCEQLNEPNRKYCDDCGTTLRVNCLNCGTSHAVWERICDGCGKRQDFFVQQKRVELTNNQDNAESLLACCDFKKSKELLEGIRSHIADPRFEDFQEWVHSFGDRLQHCYHESLASVQEKVQAAIQLVNLQNHSSAIAILRELPIELRRLERGDAPTVDSLIRQIEGQKQALEVRKYEEQQKALDRIRQDLVRMKSAIEQSSLQKDFRGAILQLNEFAKIASTHQLSEYSLWYDTTKRNLETLYRECLQQSNEAVEEARKQAIKGDLTAAITILRSLPVAWRRYRFRQDQPTLGQWLEEFETLLKKQEDARRIAKQKKLQEIVVRMQHWILEAEERIEELEFDKADALIEQLEGLCAEPVLGDQVHQVDRLRGDLQSARSRAFRRLHNGMVQAEQLSSMGEHQQAIFSMRRIPQAVLRLKDPNRNETGLEMIDRLQRQLAK
jgi:serine/threonine protein kinase